MYSIPVSHINIQLQQKHIKAPSLLSAQDIFGPTTAKKTHIIVTRGDPFPACRGPQRCLHTGCGALRWAPAAAAQPRPPRGLGTDGGAGGAGGTLRGAKGAGGAAATWYLGMILACGSVG